MKKSTNRGPIFWNGSQKSKLAAAVAVKLAHSTDGFIDAVEALNSAQDELFMLYPHLKRAINKSSIRGIFKSQSITDIFREHDVVFSLGNFWVCDFNGPPKDDLTKLMNHIDKRFEELQTVLLEELRKVKK